MISVKTMKKIFLGTQEKKTIAQNTIWLSIAELITRLSKFALIVYATRILGPTGFGQFSFALSFVMIFAVFSDLGLSQITTRELSQKRGGEGEFSNILGLKFVLSILVMLTVFIISKLTIVDDTIEKSILILSIFMITNSISDFYYAFFQAKQKMQYEACSKIIQAFFVTVLGFILLNQIKSSASLSLGYALAGTASLLYILTLYHLDKRQTAQKNKLFLPVWKKYLAMSWPLVLTSIFAMVYNDIDSVMMGYYGQITQVGWYNAAYRIMGVILVPSWLIYRTFYPVINASYRKSKEKYRVIWGYYLKISLFMIIPISLIGIIFATQIINLIFGPEYQQAVLSFRILVGVACLTLLTYPFNQALIAAHNQKKIFLATFWGALINITLNFILIPRYSLNGAAVATIIAVLIVLGMEVYYFKRLKNAYEN